MTQSSITTTTATPDYARSAPPRGNALTQTAALFLDAYRELNARKLFWATLVLSGIVVASFALIGYDENGFSIGWKHFKSNWFNTRLIPREQLYKNLFVSLGVYWWLTFIAIFLALASTAGIIPDFVTGGAIDLYLSKPIGRLRLFLTKYLTGLLFVALQVIVFCAASFLVIGVRGGAWEPGLFAAVPLVLLFYSYLYSVCALLGLLTRSTVAALLLTVLFWFVIIGVHSSETFLLMLDVSERIEVADMNRQIANTRKTLETLPTTGPTTGQSASFVETRRAMTQKTLDQLTEDRRQMSVGTYKPWHTLVYGVKWALPKTTETYQLIERVLSKQMRIPQEDLERADKDDEAKRGFFQNPALQMRAAIETDRIVRQRPATWVVGTSLGFELVVLGLAAWVFCRRDF